MPDNQLAYVNNIRMFVRVYELGSMSAAARDQRTSPAVASSRISEMEKHLGVRLFNRTTRALQPTENGRLFYDGARNILEAIADAEAEVIDANKNPRGTIYVAAPLGIGRRLIAPHVPDFKENFPNIDVRLRLSDRSVDITGEGLDLAFHMGPLPDSNLKMRVISVCPRVLCAAPKYIEQRGMPESGEDLLQKNHDCLNLRFPGAQEFQWTLQTLEGPKKYNVTGPFESDDGDVLTNWAVQGHGIILKPIFEVAQQLSEGTLVEVAAATPPLPTQLVCLYPHRKMKEAKVREFVDYMASRCKVEMASRMAAFSLP